MVKHLKPLIEQRYDAASSGIGTRKRAAEHICRFLEANPRNPRDMPSLEYERFYSACEDLLRNWNSMRILLYLPLKVLEGAPEAFKRAYRDAWYSLLAVRDVRENFHIGDCFEPDARPRGGLERVVKCAHLTPWLLKYDYINQWQLAKILEDNGSDRVLLQSFKDTWEYIRVNKILRADDLCQLTSKTASLPERRMPEPLYVSKKRIKWLEERDKPVKLLTPSAKLEGPFSDNIQIMEPELEEIASRLEPAEIVLVGGSQLKGYATLSSDIDIWTLQELELDSRFYPGSPQAAHIYLDTIWLGGEDVADSLKHVANRIMNIYTNSVNYISRPELKHQAVERLELDLLLYRLLHKGFSRFTGRDQLCIPLEMDGDCPFYDDEYRRIATMLYAKYVWL